MDAAVPFFLLLELEGKSACRREKLVRGGRNLKKSEGEVEASFKLFTPWHRI